MLANASLVDAVARAQEGLIEADPGGHIIKQHIARKGKGRSGGYRTRIAFWAADRAISPDLAGPLTRLGVRAVSTIW
jgi:hypothetical protein